VVKQLRESFVNFLCFEARLSQIGQTLQFAEGTVPAVQVVAKYLSKVPNDTCQGVAVFGKERFCEDVAKSVRAEMERRREYKYDLVKPLGMMELAPRVASLNFLLGAPFLARMFKNYSSSDRVLSNYILWRFPELEEELQNFSGQVRIATDPFFTSDDLKRAQGEETEEIIDNSGDEVLKTTRVLSNMDRISFASNSHLKGLVKTQQNFELISSGLANFL
jgi:hypothetical protein